MAPRSVSSSRLWKARYSAGSPSARDLFPRRHPPSRWPSPLCSAPPSPNTTWGVFFKAHKTPALWDGVGRGCCTDHDVLTADGCTEMLIRKSGFQCIDHSYLITLGKRSDRKCQYQRKTWRQINAFPSPQFCLPPAWKSNGKQSITQRRCCGDIFSFLLFLPTACEVGKGVLSLPAWSCLV